MDLNFFITPHSAPNSAIIISLIKRVVGTERLVDEGTIFGVDCWGVGIVDVGVVYGCVGGCVGVMAVQCRVIARIGIDFSIAERIH